MKQVNAKNFYFFNDAYFKNLIFSNLVDNWIIRLEGNVVCAALILKSPKSGFS